MIFTRFMSFWGNESEGENLKCSLEWLSFLTCTDQDACTPGFVLLIFGMTAGTIIIVEENINFYFVLDNKAIP